MKRYANVDAYLRDAEQWPEEIAALRSILRGCDLAEEIKWGKPCYVHAGANIAIIQEMKDFLALMFFKGALLDDPEGVLREQGSNTRSARRMEFRSVDEVERLESAIRACIEDAIDIEEQGLEIGPAPEPEWVDELQHRLDEDPDFAAAFERLTPGRRRAYNIYFSDAKKAETRQARITRYADKILAGKGLHDR